MTMSSAEVRHCAAPWRCWFELPGWPPCGKTGNSNGLRSVRGPNLRQMHAVTRGIRNAFQCRGVGGLDGAAARLGLKRTTLQSRMRKYNISRQFRKAKGIRDQTPLHCQGLADTTGQQAWSSCRMCMTRLSREPGSSALDEGSRELTVLIRLWRV